MPDTCATCIYFRLADGAQVSPDIETARGQCWRYPPTVNPGIFPARPLMSTHEWCGEHRQRPPDVLEWKSGDTDVGC